MRILPVEISVVEQLNRALQATPTGQGQSGYQNERKGVLLTHCNGKMIGASVHELVLKVEIVDFAQHQEKCEPQQTDVSRMRSSTRKR
jgi:hypothetical protein